MEDHFMKEKEEDIIKQLEIHFKDKYPREFAKKLKRGFYRNDRIDSAEEFYNKAKFFDLEDCYSSVFAFREWNEESSVRKQSAIIDTLVFDLDSKEDPAIAFKECKKLINWCFEHGITPRVYFSGCKGFHVYIDFKPVELRNPAEVIKRVGVYIKERLKLKTADTAVWELNRVIRAPFTIHSETNYRCTPLNPKKIIKLDFNSILHFCKVCYSPIDVHESKSFAKLLRYEDFKLATNKALNLILRPKSKPIRTKGNSWREKRIKEYVEALRKYGRLTADPVISERHKKNGNVNEHHARVHLACLMIEAGYSDEEIEEVFKLCEDFKPEVTRYQIKHIRNWLKRRG